MVLKVLFKYGLPFSFVYCTIYQQNIWREVDDQLIEEQKRTWRNFFNLVDNGYHATLKVLNLSTEPVDQRISLVSKIDSLDVRNCWNSKVHCTFTTIDQVVSNPKMIGCKIFRKLQPYISKPSEKAEGSQT